MKVTKSNGYVFIDGKREHRMVWKAKYGAIPFGWVVHHIDCVKDNNDINNLVALPTWRHDEVHAYMRKYGTVFTQEMLLKEYHELYKKHKEYEKELEYALARVKAVREDFNRIGVNNVALDKYMDKLHNKVYRKKKKVKKAKVFKDFRKPKEKKDTTAEVIEWKERNVASYDTIWKKAK